MTQAQRPQPDAACPCGRESAQRKALAYAQCCGRYIDHFDTAPAPDAESLMRSRYTAYVCGRVPYLLATWHPATRPPSLVLDEGTKWLGLAVKRAQTTGEGQAQVAFVARCREGGRGLRLQENSRFVQEGGRWYYVDGDMS